MAAIGELQGAAHIFANLKANLVYRQARLHGSKHRGIVSQQKAVERHPESLA
jgi:hypothetical protein